MSVKLTDNTIRRGALNDARMYIGESDFEADHFETHLGEVAATIIASHEKPGPNEDSAAIIPINDEHLVLIVADGVGGIAGARKASNLTVDTIRKCLADLDGTTGSRLRSAILDGIEAANQSVLALTAGSASTLALAEIGPDYVRTYHVGDSVLMHCGQRGRLKMVTTPHSPIGFAMEAGLMDEKEAMQHDELHLLFNVIGSTDMRIEIGSEFQMAPRDTLLIASDGLTDNVMQEEIITAIRIGPLDQALHRLTELAQHRMTGQQENKPCKPDDYSAILYRPARPKRRKKG